MHILGLDFATKTGVAFGDAGAPASRITTETWELPSGGGEEVGPIMHALARLLDERLMRGVQLCVFEAPYVARHQTNSGHTAFSIDQIRRAFGMAALCEQLCYARGIPCLEAVTVTLKKKFGGHGRAQKSDMIAAARRRGFTVNNDHEADACACWFYGIEKAQPQHLHRYDPIFAKASS